MTIAIALCIHTCARYSRFNIIQLQLQMPGLEVCGINCAQCQRDTNEYCTVSADPPNDTPGGCKTLGGSQNPRRIGDKKMIFHVTARYLRLLLPGPVQRQLGPANMSRHSVSFLYELWLKTAFGGSSFLHISAFECYHMHTRAAVDP